MNHIHKHLIALCSSVLLASTAATVSAQTEHGPDRRAEPDAEISLGLGVVAAPDYLGAKNTSVQPIPMVFIKQGPFYLDSARGIGYLYETQSGLFFGQALNWDPGRTDHDTHSRPGSDRLRGMGTVKGALVTTAELGYNFLPWLTLRAEGEFALTERNRGNRYSIGLEGGLWAEENNEVWYSAYAHLSDGRFTQSYFGVTPSQSTASAFSSYKPDRGLYAYSASINWEHRFTKHWSALVSVNAVTLTGDAGKSPIVQEKFNTYALGAINYTF